MEELGYLPNATARALAKSRTNTIGFLTHDLSNPPYQLVIEGVESVVRERNYSLLLCDSRHDAEIQSANLRRLFERRIDGLIVLFLIGGTCREIELFTRAGIPVVEMGVSRHPVSLPRLRVGYPSGMGRALEYLKDLGHRRIGLISSSVPPFDERILDYRELVPVLGLDDDPSLAVLVRSSAEAAAVTRAMVTGEDRPTALVSGVHYLTPYILGEIRRAGLAIPRDISFLTMGDSSWAEACLGLTSLTLDSLKRGRLAAEYIFARLAGEEGTEFLQRTTPQLVVRESCAPPRLER